MKCNAYKVEERAMIGKHTCNGEKTCYSGLLFCAEAKHAAVILFCVRPLIVMVVSVFTATAYGSGRLAALSIFTPALSEKFTNELFGDVTSLYPLVNLKLHSIYPRTCSVLAWIVSQIIFQILITTKLVSANLNFRYFLSYICQL